MHTLIRQFIPKGSAIGKYSKNYISEIKYWINNYSRRILDSSTSMQRLKMKIAPDIQQIFQRSA